MGSRSVLHIFHIRSPLVSSFRGFTPYCYQFKCTRAKSIVRNVSTKFTINQPKRGSVSSLLKKIGWFDISRLKLQRSGVYLYETVADQINYNAFFKEFNMPDTFNSWFIITELHVWMLMVRAMAEEDEGRYIRNIIVKAMWADVNTRSKKLEDASLPFVKQQVSDISEQFQAAIVGYDEGLLSNDRVLAGAVWGRFFDCNIDKPQPVELLVSYIRQQIRILDLINKEDFLLNAKVSWIDPLTLKIDR